MTTSKRSCRSVFDLPAVPEQVLNKQVAGAIEEALSDVSDQGAVR